MWVKICGNTNLEDAAYAAEHGADAVGFVFAPSKRQVTTAQVAAITLHLPATVERVGVFDSHDAAEIAGIAHEAGLTAVQLHGGLDDALLEQLAGRLGSVRIIQTLHWNVELSAAESAGSLTRQLERVASLGTIDCVLIDSKLGTVSGGTGIAYDWDAARTVFEASPSRLELVLAGGLKPGNVGTAIDMLKPWGVDVASGVESLPGRKDPALVEDFIKIARGVETP